MRRGGGGEHILLQVIAFKEEDSKWSMAERLQHPVAEGHLHSYDLLNLVRSNIMIRLHMLHLYTDLVAFL